MADVIWHTAPPFPSLADAFYLAAYALFIAGLAVLVRKRTAGSDRSGALDTLIVTGGIFVLSWTFLIEPYFSDSALPGLAKVVSIAYPLIDMVLLGLLVRLTFTFGRRNSAFLILTAGVMVQLTADASYAVTILNGSFAYGHPLTAGWLVSFSLISAAALHPSMSSLTTPSKISSRAGSWRLATLSASALLPSAVLVIGDFAEAEQNDIAFIALISAALFILVMLRIRDLMTDVEQQQRTEQELKRQALELERSNAELEQFAYVASHDLQEPLRMVASYVRLLARRYEGRLDDRADQYIAYAVDGALRMQALINGLLEYSRVGRSDVHEQATDCRTVVQLAVGNLESSIQESGATIDYNGLPTVVADQTQLVQLFQNLISNAIKFRSESSPVVTIAGDPEGEQWILKVADNGIGMESHHVERIFSMFQRLHSRDEYPGMGIGLAVCKKIVERLGGRIWVESTPGTGSTFLFTLPASKETA